MDKIYSDIGSFEKRLKQTAPLEHNIVNEGSSDDEEIMTEMDRMKDKNRVLLEKLYKAEQ